MYLQQGVEHLYHGLHHHPRLLHPLCEDGGVHQHPQRVPDHHDYKYYILYLMTSFAPVNNHEWYIHNLLHNIINILLIHPNVLF